MQTMTHPDPPQPFQGQGLDEKLPPSNIEAEEAVLGSLMIDRDAVVLVAPYLRPEHFYREKNGWIYGTIQQMYQDGVPADFVTLCDELERRWSPNPKEGSYLDAVGGREYLTALLNAVPTAVHVEFYARIVYRCWFQREGISGGGRLAGEAYRDDADPQTILAAAEEIVAHLRNADAGAEERQGISFKREMTSRMMDNQDEIARMIESGLSYPLLPWMSLREGMLKNEQGETVLTPIVPAILPSKLVMIAALPGHGKTICVAQIAAYNAMLGHQVSLYHNELTEYDMWTRVAASRDFVASPAERVRGLIDRQAMIDFHQNLNAPDGPDAWKGDVTLYPCPGWTIDEICGQIRQDVARGRCTLACLDYLQLIHVDVPRNSTAEFAWNQVAQRLKETADRTKVPIVVATQITKEGYHPPDGDIRTTPKLGMGMIRDTNAYMAVANVIVMPYIERVANQTCSHWLVQMNVCKNTLGALALPILRWDARRFAFADVVPPDREKKDSYVSL